MLLSTIRISQWIRVLSTKAVGSAALLALFILCSEVALGQTSNNPSRIMDQYRSQRIQWTTNIWPYANTLFGLLAVIEFAWSAAIMLLEKADLQSWTAALVRKIMWIGAFYALLLNGRIWIPAIIQSFEQIGETASGVAALSPSGVFSQGLNVAGGLMDSASTSAFFTNPGTSLALVFAAIVIVLSYAIITIQFIVAMVESYIIVAAGFIFVGFGGSRWTAPYVERYIGLGVATGVKIMLLYLLIGAGMNFAVDWQTQVAGLATSPTPMMTAFDVMGASVIFMMLCWQIPKLFSAVLGGAPALTGGDLMATTTGLIAGAVGVGAVAAGGAGLLAGGAATGAASTASAGSSASGGSNVASMVAAVGSGSGGGNGGPVPPPSAPGAGSSGSGGVPQQPGPPTPKGSGGVAADVANISTPSTNGTTVVAQNRGSAGVGSNGKDSGAASGRSNITGLAAIGGEPLAGSGFEAEPSAKGFAPGSVNVSPPSADASGGTSTGQILPPRLAPSGDIGDQRRVGLSAGREAPEASLADVGSTAGGSVVSDVTSVSSSAPNTSQPPNRRTGKETLGSARRAGSAALRLDTAQRQLRRAIPSDAAPQPTPPRMPIDQND